MNDYDRQRQERLALQILRDLIGDGALDHLRYTDAWPEMRGSLREFEAYEDQR